MRDARLLALLAVLLVFTISCDQPSQPMDEHTTGVLQKAPLPENGAPIPGQYIVVLEQNPEPQRIGKQAAVQAIQRITASHAIPAQAITTRFTTALVGFAAVLQPKQLDQLQSDPAVAYIERDKYMVLAPPFPPPGQDDGEDETGQTTPWGITRVNGGADGIGLTAWVIDTGVDLDHPDLQVDDELSTTVISRGPDSKDADDGNGHGTHVAGTIAALDNDIDVVGVAAGATIVAVKVLDRRGSGSYSDVIAGVDYVATNAATGDVANMSLGGPTSQALDDAVTNAADQGILFAIAAGNDSDDANNYSPARVEPEGGGVWTISAFDKNGVFASFSNWSGPTAPPIEYSEPGINILSLYKDGGTRTLSGTSMASPHAAGLLLLNGAGLSTDGTVSEDPDGDPDPIAVN